MPKNQSEIFEITEEDVVQQALPAKKTTVKQKKEISAERLAQLKEQLARGRATRLANREKSIAKPDAKTDAKPDVKTVVKPDAKPVVKPVANQIWGEEIAELKNEIKSLKSRLDKPKDNDKSKGVVVSLPEKKSQVIKKDVVVKKNMDIPKNPVVSRQAPTPAINIPKPKPAIYSAFKVANW